MIRRIPKSDRVGMLFSMEPHDLERTIGRKTGRACRLERNARVKAERERRIVSKGRYE